MVLKELRAEKGKKLGFKKSASQSFVNSDFEQKYKITLNMGRIESNPNFELKEFLRLKEARKRPRKKGGSTK